MGQRKGVKNSSNNKPRKQEDHEKGGKKESWIDLHCQGIVGNIKKNVNEKAYQLLKVLTSTKQGQANTIHGKNGN